MIDSHCHIIFEVDDGAHSFEESVEMLRLAWEDGIRGIFATPHIHGMTEKLDIAHWQRVTSHFERLKAYAMAVYPDMKLYLGAELLITTADCQLDRFLWENGQMYGLNGTKYLLVEFSYDINFQLMQKAIKSAVNAGFTPIIAHVEIYSCLRGDLSSFSFSNTQGDHIDPMNVNHRRLMELKAQGAVLTVTASTVVGKLDHSAMKWAMKAIGKGLIDVVMSDAHSAVLRRPQLKHAFEMVAETYGFNLAKAIFDTRPAAFATGEALEPLAVHRDKREPSWHSVTAVGAVAMICLLVGAAAFWPMSDSAKQLASHQNPTDVVDQQSASQVVDLGSEDVALGAATGEATADFAHLKSLEANEAVKQLLANDQQKLVDLQRQYDNRLNLLSTDAKAKLAKAKADERKALRQDLLANLEKTMDEADTSILPIISEMRQKLEDANLPIDASAEAAAVYGKIKRSWKVYLEIE